MGEDAPNLDMSTHGTLWEQSDGSSHQTLQPLEPKFSIQTGSLDSLLLVLLQATLMI